MTPYEQQAAEIKTKKPREFEINLSNADVNSLALRNLFQRQQRKMTTPKVRKKVFI